MVQLIEIPIVIYFNLLFLPHHKLPTFKYALRIYVHSELVKT